jgi:hypothetical protein
VDILKVCDSEEEARAYARQVPEREIAIIKSEGRYYVEAGDGGIIRTWERLVYQGKGREA